MNRVETANHLKVFDMELYLNTRLECYQIKTKGKFNISPYQNLFKNDPNQFKIMAKDIPNIMARGVS